ncbi:hypothetical protein Tco_0030609, partial [Tanacetum coccineum]
MPVPEYPPSPDYVPGPEYPEYFVPSDDEAPIEDQPLPADASLTSLSPGYVADSDPSEEDLEENPTEYPADRGNDDDEEEEEEEASKKHEEEEHLAPIESTTLLAIDPVPSVKDTKAFETDESAPAPPVPSPRLHSLTTITTTITTTHTSPTYVDAPLGYRAAMIQSSVASPLPLPAQPSSPLLLPATDHREDVPEADVPPQKRLCLTAPAPRFEVGESSAAATTRQPGLDITPATDYRFVDTVDATPRCHMSIEVGYEITDVWDD